MGKLRMVSILSVALSVTQVISIPTSANGLLRRVDSDFDPYDLSYIKKIAAIGDSYSAGIGAGNRLGSVTDPGAWACSRYDHAYPNLVNGDPSLGAASGRKFQFESCSGALLDEVRDDQVKRIDDGQDVIMLSAGGNDAKLVDVLNQCVFQIFAPTKLTAGLIKANFKWSWIKDVDKFARSCEETLDDSEKIIDASAFSSDIESLVTKTLAKLNSKGTLYYTGYAKFWAEDMSDNDQCSNTDWSVFLSHADKWSFQDPVKLTKARRTRMNQLVEKVNGKISDVIKKHSDKAVFVDYDRYFGLTSGRFCQPGVTEPNTKRVGLDFYELDINDPLGTTPFKRSGGDVYGGTFEYDVNQLGDYAKSVGSSLKDGAIPAGDIDSNDNGGVDKRLPNALPDGYGRVFHPQTTGHQIIANAVLYDMAVRNGNANGVTFETMDIVVEKEDTCPIDGGSSTTPSTDQPKAECDMDKASGLPYNVFTGMYGQFCDAVGKAQKSSLTWMVDSRGNKLQLLRRDLDKRTPPANPDTYNDYKTGLIWTPGKDTNANCAKSCKDTYSALANSPCGHTAGQQNIMTSEGKMDVGCGTYEYTINSPKAAAPAPKAPVLGDQKCHGSNDFGSHKDINGDFQAQYIGWACAGTAYKNMKAGDPLIEWQTMTNGAPYHYKISWIDGCTTTETTQNVAQPLKDDSKTTCLTLFSDDFTKCNNGGVGGYRDAGCLRYEFLATYTVKT